MKPHVIHQIKQWAKNPEYYAGVEIFRSINPALAATLAQAPSKPNIRKLTMKLAWFAKINPPKTYVGNIAATSDVAEKTQPAKVKSSTKEVKITKTKSSPPEDDQQKTKEIHPDVQRVMKEHTKLFQLRSQIAEKRLSLGSQNDDQTKKARKIYGETIQELSQRIELLYNARENYFKHNMMPDMQELFPVDFIDHDPEVLQKKRLNLMKSLNRDKTLLNFGQYKRKKKPDPIPEGPERDKVIARINQREREIAEIDNILKSIKK